MNGWVGPAGSAPVSSPRPAIFSQQRLEQSALRRFLAEHPHAHVQVAVPVPHVAPERLLDHEQLRVFWSHGGRSCVGFGVAAEVDASGEGRFSSIQAAAPALLDGHVDFPLGSVAAPPAPRLFGGFAFAAGHGQTRGEPWSAFGDARFVLPRLCYWARAGEPALLSLFLRRGEQQQCESWFEHLEVLAAWLQRLAEEPAPALRRETAPPVRQQQGDAAHWQRLIRSILQGIDAQQWSKVVAARRRELAFADSVSLSRTMRVLAESHPASTRFAFRFGGAAFVGATPEHLLSKRGSNLRTEALAGTFRTESRPFAAELLQRPKERGEHTPVLRAIVEALAPYCRSIEHAEAPQLRSLKHVLHLCTPIEAQLAGPRHVLELLERMHPTPAVGGVPTQRAVRWILANEPFDRGWYCGPIGWFDGDGDGDFEVALRSGVVRGERVHLFAGAGIVAGSEPAAEYEETELKLRALRSALRT